MEKRTEENIFVDENKLKEFRRNGKLIEARTYQTVYGPWTYFTADDGQVSWEMTAIWESVRWSLL